MIVYRNQEHTIKTQELLSPICTRFRELQKAAHPSPAAVEKLLVDFGVLESGLADALIGDVAMPCEETRLARRASIALGRLFHNVVRQLPAEHAMERACRTLADLTGCLLPSRIRVSTPEGYAYYGLYPEAYLQAADAVAAGKQPARAVVIGIRSIGTSLSAVVAAALEERGCRTRSYTVRPGGHPWDRKLMSTDLLEREWAQQRVAEFFIVDEGPGMSGSSFACVAAKLSQCGIPDDRISFICSWDAPPECLCNEAARSRWRLHKHYFGQAGPSWTAGLRDISAGVWRRDLYGDDTQRWPAVQPQHELRKYLSPANVMMKFAGLGAYGEWKLDRQRLLADAGFTPNALGFTDGFLALEYIPGSPLRQTDLSPALLDHMADYLAFRRRSFPASRSIPFETMIEMIETNTREAFDDAPAFRSFRRLAAAFDARPAIEIDGRMMPHEWISAREAVFKADAVDHHANHFLPGGADIAWDLAGAAVEWGMRHSEQQYLVDRYTGISGDAVPPELIRFYRLAYLAFRTGYASTSASGTAGTPDHDRFQLLRAAYSGLFRREVDAFAVRPVRIPA